MKSVSDGEQGRLVLERMQRLGSLLSDCGYEKDETTLMLTRIMICCFSDALHVFGSRSFYDTVREAGKGRAGYALHRIFEALAGKIPEENSGKKFLPVISSQIFSQELPEKEFPEGFENVLLSCGEIRFEEISPAIFGALFQNITDREERRTSGAYYTNEENIDRILAPLFMDSLRAERKKLSGNRNGLKKFLKKLTQICVLDPACGCGNILLRAYMRLRLLELDVLEELYSTGQRVLDISLVCNVSTHQFIGIELDPVEAGITRICMWLTKRKMDLAAAELFGIPEVLPEEITGMGIRVGNAISERWEDIVDRKKLSYIIGNPPYVGARLMTASQKADMKLAFGTLSGLGNLDYVAAWYKKTAEFIAGTGIKAAFVSTNSITQGEQASILWKELVYKHGMEIDFAYRTFVWTNLTGGAAKVHCVIIGFSAAAPRKPEKILFDGDRRSVCRHINAYLTEGDDVFIISRRKPVSDVPEMVFGSMPNDGGHLILSAAEKEKMLEAAPELARVIRPYTGSEDFLKGRFRYCIWADGTAPDELLKHPLIAERISAVRQYRERSSRGSTKILALHPDRFGEIRQPESGKYLLVPRVSSARREYIPVGFLDADVIAGDAVLMVPGASKALFALMSSRVHMIFVRAAAGRLKSDLRYSASFIYNNFPFPDIDEYRRAALDAAADGIMTARKAHSELTPAQMYGENMPEDLRAAHRINDEVTEKIFGFAGSSDSEILSGLFGRIRGQH